MKRMLSLTVFISLFLAGEVTAEHGVVREQTQGGVTFITGGVGKEEQTYLRSVRSQYNLHLLFAVRGSGAFVANVQIRIDDATGATVLDTGTDGPHMFLRLKPGSYMILADRGGHVITHKVVVDSRQRGADLVFAFPREMADS